MGYTKVKITEGGITARTKAATAIKILPKNWKEFEYTYQLDGLERTTLLNNRWYR